MKPEEELEEAELEESEPRLKPSSQPRLNSEPILGSQLGSSQAQPSSERFICRFCGRSFKSLQALRGHLAHCPQRGRGEGDTPIEAEETEELRILQAQGKGGSGPLR